SVREKPGGQEQDAANENHQSFEDGLCRRFETRQVRLPIGPDPEGLGASESASQGGSQNREGNRGKESDLRANLEQKIEFQQGNDGQEEDELGHRVQLPPPCPTGTNQSLHSCGLGRFPYELPLGNRWRSARKAAPSP